LAMLLRRRYCRPSGRACGPRFSHHYLVCTVRADGSVEVRKRDVPSPVNLDYPEYVLRSRFHWLAGGLAALFVVSAGILLLRGTGASGMEPAGSRDGETA